MLRLVRLAGVKWNQAVPVPGPVRETKNADRRWVSLFCEVNPICAGERRTQNASHRRLWRPAGVEFIDEKR
jgi:hypothetical protein